LVRRCFDGLTLINFGQARSKIVVKLQQKFQFFFFLVHFWSSSVCNKETHTHTHTHTVMHSFNIAVRTREALNTNTWPDKRVRLALHRICLTAHGQISTVPVYCESKFNIRNSFYLFGWLSVKVDKYKLGLKTVTSLHCLQ
jgi:hypothetical protein